MHSPEAYSFLSAGTANFPNETANAEYDVIRRGSAQDMELTRDLLGPDTLG